MSYRRPNDAGVFDSRWRIKHRAKLADLGIPPDIANDDRRWSYVLLHGNDAETGWTQSWLSDHQAANLLTFLDPYFPERAGLWLVQMLQRRLGNGK